MLRRLQHPNIISLIEQRREHSYILLITELHGSSWSLSNPEINPSRNPGLKFSMRGKQVQKTKEQMRKRTSCDLFECIDARIVKFIPDTTIPEPTARIIFAQIIMAIEYMHKNGVVHRDIKDENVVVDASYKVKLIDFGSASEIPHREEEYFTKFNGTAHFASPEVAKGYPYRGPESEIWYLRFNARALGVLLYTIVFGENPFQHNEDIIQGKYNLSNRKISKGTSN
jgi:serine/threonine protein kinase